MVWNSTTQDQEGHTIPQSMTLGEGAAIEIISANTLHLEALQRDINALGRRITKPADVPPHTSRTSRTPPTRPSSDEKLV